MCIGVMAPVGLESALQRRGVLLGASSRTTLPAQGGLPLLHSLRGGAGAEGAGRGSAVVGIRGGGGQRGMRAAGDVPVGGAALREMEERLARLDGEKALRHTGLAPPRKARGAAQDDRGPGAVPEEDTAAAVGRRALPKVPSWAEEEADASSRHKGEARGRAGSKRDSKGVPVAPDGTEDVPPSPGRGAAPSAPRGPSQMQRDIADAARMLGLAKALRQRFELAQEAAKDGARPAHGALRPPHASCAATADAGGAGGAVGAGGPGDAKRGRVRAGRGAEAGNTTVADVTAARAAADARSDEIIAKLRGRLLALLSSGFARAPASLCETKRPPRAAAARRACG
jgi:hypothetical protein